MVEAPVENEKKHVDNSNTKIINILKKMNLFSKKMSWQIPILVSLAIFVGLILYYIIYDSYRADLILNGILPISNSWVIWIVSIGIPICLIITYLAPFHQKYLNQTEIKVQKLNISEKALESFNKQDYQTTKEMIEQYFAEVHKHDVSFDRNELMILLKKSNIILIITRNIAAIETHIDNMNKDLALREYQNTNGFLNQNLDTLPDEIVQKFELLLHKINQI